MTFANFSFNNELFGVNKAFDSNKNPKTALVLGAGILNNQKPSQILKNRLDKAVELFENGKISKIIVSGDNRASNYDEPKAMSNYLLEKQIPQSAILADNKGFRTLESCIEAKDTFKENQIYLISQDFHLPRAAFLCRVWGLEVKTVSANDSSTFTNIYGWIREIPSSWKAVIDYTKYRLFNYSNGDLDGGNSN